MGYFPVFDELYCNQTNYVAAETVLYRSSHRFTGAAAQILGDDFRALFQTCGVRSTELIDDVFASMWISIFVRMFATFIYLCFTEEASITDVYNRSGCATVQNFIGNLYDCLKRHCGENAFFGTKALWANVGTFTVVRSDDGVSPLKIAKMLTGLSSKRGARAGSTLKQLHVITLQPRSGDAGRYFTSA